MFEPISDAGLLEVMGEESREESAACARRLIAIGELYARRAPEDDTEHLCWAIDGFSNITAEIAAELNISRHRAAAQLDMAIDLRERFPLVAKVFATGVIDSRLVAALINRSVNVTDPDALARLDAAFAAHAPKWMARSGPKLNERIDMWVERFDPAGVREPRTPREDRHVYIGPSGRPGMAGIWGQLPLTDGAALDERLDGLAATVCRGDARTKDQRRLDALYAAVFGQRLQCQCGSPDCTKAGDAEDEPSGQVVIHVIAEQASLDGAATAPGYLPGFGAVPAPQLRELAATAKLKPVRLPAPACEAQYRPSAALAEFVRCRDLTCRFPGCDEPAKVCDIDHTIPYPAGPTHPSNLKLLCRFHHLLKTFYTGAGGWADKQLPDGTVIWTSPSGQTYTTTPGGALFFPILATPTGDLVIPESQGPASAHRDTMMPLRKRTRAHDRAYRIALERQHTEARIADEKRERDAWIAANYEPPPF